MPPNKGVQISNPMYDIEDTPRDTPRSDEDDEEPQIPEDANRTAGDSDRADGTDEQPPQATAAGSQPDSSGRKKSVRRFDDTLGLELNSAGYPRLTGQWYRALLADVGVAAGMVRGQ